MAAALSAGRSSVAAGTEAGGVGEREVFLGSASGPLLDVVRKPQVLSFMGCWCECAYFGWLMIMMPVAIMPVSTGAARFHVLSWDSTDAT